MYACMCVLLCFLCVYLFDLFLHLDTYLLVYVCMCNLFLEYGSICSRIYMGAPMYMCLMLSHIPKMCGCVGVYVHMWGRAGEAGERKKTTHYRGACFCFGDLVEVYTNVYAYMFVVVCRYIHILHIRWLDLIRMPT